MYDGVLSKVYSNQNKGRAFIYGFSSNFKAQLNEHFMLGLMLNYTYGRIKTDSVDTPMDHIPPFTTRLLFNYTNKKFSSDFFINYNGWKHLKDYAFDAGAEDNIEYATADGMPAWFTANIHFSYQVHKYVTLNAGIDNIFDTQYRTFASGINGSGRNIFGSLRFKF